MYLEVSEGASLLQVRLPFQIHNSTKTWGLGCKQLIKNSLGPESGSTRMAPMKTTKSEPIHIEALAEQKSETCREILEALPEWFGIPAAIDAYAKGVAELPMLVAKDRSGLIIGFIALKPQTPSAVEAYVLGIRREYQRKGYGHLLFEAAERMARKLGARFLTVKTLAETRPDPHYRATRLFYESIGFEPIEVFPTLWSPENPCLLMAKTLR